MLRRRGPALACGLKAVKSWPLATPAFFGPRLPPLPRDVYEDLYCAAQMRKEFKARMRSPSAARGRRSANSSGYHGGPPDVSIELVRIHEAHRVAPAQTSTVI